MPDAVWYVYAVVPADTSLAGAPSGVEGASVTALHEGGLAALASPLDGREYAAERVSERAGDVAWVGPRAVAHDGVTTWAVGRGDAVPLPMFTLFASEGAVRAMLRERADALARALAHVRGREEYAVRVYRHDDRLSASLAAVSPEVAELERRAGGATPGQRYLLSRKLEDVRRAELRRVGAEVAHAVHERLAAAAADAASDALPAAEGAGGTAVLNGAYLVPRDGVTAFREALTALVAAHEPRGFRFEFTGPWAPYHFARAAGPRES
ncbi:MAG: GvpL/GvpF family gas vesicle protein [Gemmatimonadaceae bacterium]